MHVLINDEEFASFSQAERDVACANILEDEEQCAKVEQQYGKITRKCVIYRGPDTILENGIEYRNAEAYLKSL